MSCKDYELKLGAFVDGEISSQERHEVETHLSACQVCTRLAEDFRGIDELAAAGEVPPVSGEEWSRMFQEILHQREEATTETAPQTEGERVIPFSTIESRRKASPRKLLLAVAAAAALILFGLYLGTSLFETSGPEPGRIADPGTPTESSKKGEDFAETPGEPKPEIQGEPEDEISPLDPPDEP